MRRVFVVAVAVIVSALLGPAGGASAKDVEPYSFCLGNTIFTWDVSSSDPGPLVQDTIQFFGIGALVQHTIVVDRMFNPATMRGTVSGTVGATGPDNHFGILHGVITPDGMSGTIVITRLREDGATDKFVGRWSSAGHPDSLTSSYAFCFEGRFIISS